MRRLATVLAAASIIITTQAGAAALADSARAATPAVRLAVTPAAVPAVVKYKFKNCTAMNKVYPHGVGKKGARDHTSGKRVQGLHQPVQEDHRLPQRAGPRQGRHRLRARLTYLRGRHRGYRPNPHSDGARTASPSFSSTPRGSSDSVPCLRQAPRTGPD